MRNNEDEADVSQELMDQLIECFLEVAVDRTRDNFDLSKSEHFSAWRRKAMALTKGFIKPNHLFDCVHLLVPKKPVAVYCYAVLHNSVTNRSTYFLSADAQGTTPFAVGRVHQFNKEASEQFEHLVETAVAAQQATGNVHGDACVKDGDTNVDEASTVFEEVESNGTKFVRVTPFGRGYFRRRRASHSRSEELLSGSASKQIN